MKKIIFILGIFLAQNFILADEVAVFCSSGIIDLKTNECLYENIVYINNLGQNGYLNDKILEECSNLGGVGDYISKEDVSCKLNGKEIAPQLEQKYRKTYVGDEQADIKTFFEKYKNFCDSKNLKPIGFGNALNPSLGCGENPKEAKYLINDIIDASKKCYNQYLDFADANNWSQITKICSSANWENMNLDIPSTKNISSVSSKIENNNISGENTNTVLSSQNNLVITTSSTSSTISASFSSSSLDSSSLSPDKKIITSSSPKDSKNIYLFVVGGLILFSLGLLIGKKGKN